MIHDTWVCETCESENGATMDRCEMCDSANPNQATKQLRQASTDTIDNIGEMEIYDSFMQKSGLNRRLAAVQVVPLPLLNEFSEDEDQFEEGAHSSFQPCDTFQGERDGFLFKSGPKGTGYYPDVEELSKGESKSGSSSRKRRKY